MNSYDFSHNNLDAIFSFQKLSHCQFPSLNISHQFDFSFLDNLILNKSDFQTSLSDSILISDTQSVTAEVDKLMNEERERLKTFRNRIYYLLLFLFLGFVVKAYFMYRYYKKTKRQRAQMLLENKNLQMTKKENKELQQKINTSFDEVIQLAKENSSEFLIRFQEVYPHCYYKLVHLYPDLQTSEIKFCAMLYLNFSTKDIAEFTFVTPKAVQNRKNRLRKKLNISSDEDLNVWMKKTCD
ncbi:helix-turn-helix transcriptional regulator [Moheibacter sediminis]|uniref:helix-turn-helix transcriptional regulator n=1 Tax=Moheibacter sediminis TaxID=1434700 RepID=UPI0011810CC8|nr:hypothetical protein [Moheibacter sediminis]